MGGTPPVNEWTTYHYELSERGRWAWVDGEYPMSELPLATTDQIRQVLTSLTAILIRGEVITGDDQGWLDNVTLAGPERPVLNIRALGADVELSWPATAMDYLLEGRSAVASGDWTPIDTHGTNIVRLARAPGSACFRLRQPGQSAHHNGIHVNDPELPARRAHNRWRSQDLRYIRAVNLNIKRTTYEKIRC